VTRVGRVDRAIGLRELFDCALSEIELPDGSGIELISALLEDQRIRTAVFHTDCRDTELLEKARKLGPVVDKLGDLDELCAIVSAEVERASTLENARRLAGGSVTAYDPSPGRQSGQSGTRRRLR
jgi:DNA-binding response OmpR family regulator